MINFAKECVYIPVLQTLAKLNDVNVRAAVAGNLHIPHESFQELADDNESTVRKAVASNLNTPPDVLSELVRDEETSVRKTVAANRNTPPDALGILAHDEDSFVRSNSIDNASITQETLATIANTKEINIRQFVGRNERTPPDALTRLAKSAEHEVRIAVAGNISTPPHVLNDLSLDSEINVRRAVAGNPSTTQDILTKLSDDPTLYKEVAGNPSTPSSVLIFLANAPSGWEYKEIICAVAKNTSTPLDVLKALASNDNRDVRYDVARNTRTPPEILERLSADKDIWVKNGVAQNAGTPVEALLRLAGGNDEQILVSLASNARTPDGVLGQMASHRKQNVRVAVASNPKTNRRTLEILADDPTRPVRLAVADNPSVPHVDIRDGDRVLASVSMASIEVDLSGKEINSLINVHGLDKLPALERIYLHRNNLNDLQGFENLLSKRIEEIWFTGDHIRSLRGIEKVNLEYLYVNFLECEVLETIEEIGKKNLHEELVDKIGGILPDRLRDLVIYYRSTTVEALDAGEYDLAYIEYKGSRPTLIPMEIDNTIPPNLKHTNRKENVLHFEMLLTGLGYSKIKSLDQIVFDTSTDKGDDKKFVFKPETFRPIELRNKGSKLDKKWEFESEDQQWKIDSDYKLSPYVRLSIVDLKYYPGGTNLRIKNKQFFIKLGGSIGRFIDNVMTKLVFISFLTSATGFISSKFGTINPDLTLWLDIAFYGIIFGALFYAIINHTFEMHRKTQTLKNRKRNPHGS